MSNKTLAKKIFNDALEASLPKNFISKHCRLQNNVLIVNEDSYDLAEYKNIYIFGSGKAAFTMAKEIEKLLGERVFKGLIVAPKSDEKLTNIEVCEGSHPLPTQKSFDSAKKLLQMMQECQREDLYIYLLSGGSSALIELPMAPITLDEFQKTTQLMLHNALEIQEINSVRKHISQIKGGRLAESCQARGVVLVLSDIIGNDLHSIGSAPLYADLSSYAEAKEILESKNIFHLLPKSVQEVLQKGCLGLLDETPKLPQKSVKHYLLASNTQALNAAAKSAKSQGLSVKVVHEPMQGEVTEMLKKMLSIAKSSREQCIIFGGECTLKVSGNGQGGRNQHAVALMLQTICREDLDICFLSAGSDGIDGNSDAAGAVISRDTCQNVDMKELEKHITNFDSYNFFKKMQTLVMTGASGTNVIDVAIIIKGE
jgi:glycerate-2-kinase